MVHYGDLEAIVGDALDRASIVEAEAEFMVHAQQVGLTGPQIREIMDLAGPIRIRLKSEGIENAAKLALHLAVQEREQSLAQPESHSAQG